MKPQKFRTNSHRAVREPGDAWIPAQLDLNEYILPNLAKT